MSAVLNVAAKQQRWVHWALPYDPQLHLNAIRYVAASVVQSTGGQPRERFVTKEGVGSVVHAKCGEQCHGLAKYMSRRLTLPKTAV